MTHDLSLIVNGEALDVAVDGTRRLSDLLRDTLRLTGLNIGCEEGVCGACTVLINGRSARACLTLAVQCAGTRIETVEGLTPTDGSLSAAQVMLHRHNAFQCGYCTSGFLVLIEEMRRDGIINGAAIDDRLSSVICRCTGYQPIRSAARELLAIKR